jgi:hypothetical protein
MRDARSASQGFPPDFPNEFRNFGALARNVFSPRRRCEIRSNFDYFIYSICFDTKRIFAILIMQPIGFLIFFSCSKSRLGQLDLSDWLHQGGFLSFIN